MNTPTKDQYNYALVMVDSCESEINDLQSQIKEHQKVIFDYEAENPDEA